jgi:hypothetical protein
VIYGEVRQEGRDLRVSNLRGMAFVMEENEPLDPMKVSLLSADAIVLEAQEVANLV